MSGRNIEYPIIDLLPKVSKYFNVNHEADKMWFHRAFGYNGRYIFITHEGHIKAHVGAEDEIKGWSDKLAEHHLPTPMFDATLAWYKSGNTLPLAEFLRIMFNQQVQ